MDIEFLEEEISKHIVEYDKAIPGILREKKQHMDCLVRELTELPEKRYHIHRRKQLQRKIKSVKKKKECILLIQDYRIPLNHLTTFYYLPY